MSSVCLPEDPDSCGCEEGQAAQEGEEGGVAVEFEDMPASFLAAFGDISLFFLWSILFGVGGNVSLKGFRNWNFWGFVNAKRSRV